ncbi:MAG TPA: PHB depolymerase family esterase [Polyangiaceae bacterium]|nr:PHB depolymerase family esterase [Polyangiaceae bacterium]
MTVLVCRRALLWHVSASLALTALACGSNSSEGSGGGDAGHSGTPASSAGGPANAGQGGHNDAGTTGGGGTTGAAGTGSSGLAGTPTGGSGAAQGGMSSGNAGHAGSLAGHGGQTGGNGQGGAATAAAGSGSGGSSGGGSGSLASPGCSKTPALKSGTQSITSSGQNRSYMIRVPENYDKDHPYWLIFGFHWVGGTANDVDSGGTSGYTWSYYGLRELADKSTASRAIFVAPQGISNGWGNSNNQDVVLTDDIIKLVEGDLCVDTKHVFSTGFSYGGGMTKALGCQRPNVFRAIAVYSGADFLSGGCDNSSTSPIAYIGLHSVSDGTNSYASGVAIRDRFVKNDGCTAQTTPNPPSNTTHVCTTYQGCKPGYPVEWCAFDGGGHSPAPVDGSSNGSGGGDKTWTKAEVWKFFTQF